MQFEDIWVKSECMEEMQIFIYFLIVLTGFLKDSNIIYLIDTRHLVDIDIYYSI